MKAKFMIAAAAAALLVPLAASAQFLGKNEEKTIGNARFAAVSGRPSPASRRPMSAPNKPHWKLSEILASHKGQTDWVQPVVRNTHQEADYISLGVGKKTKQISCYGDDRVVFIVWDGSLKVSASKARSPSPPTKGFMVNVPLPPHAYHAGESVGDKPGPALRSAPRRRPAALCRQRNTRSHRWQDLRAGAAARPAWPRMTGPNPIYVDYMKEFNGTEKAVQRQVRLGRRLHVEHPARQGSRFGSAGHGARAISMPASPNSGSSWKARSASRSKACPTSPPSRAT